VGGIRTYLKYVYPLISRELDGVKISMVVPRVAEFETLQQDLLPLGIRYVDVEQNCTVDRLARSINREVANRSYDLIHSHGFTAALACSLVAKVRRIPHLTTVHDILQDTQFAGLKGAARRLGLKMALRLVDVVQAVGEDAGQNLISHLGAGLSPRIRVVRNGILTQPILRAVPRDLRSELNLDANALLIGFFGRFMAQKGFAFLVEAIRLLRERSSKAGRSFHVVAFGGGGFIREEQAAIDRAGLKHSFSFMPFVPQIAAALKSVDVVAIPSLWEAMPLLPMEAMVAGVPVIGTDCIGLAEVLVDTPATVVPAANADTLAAALEKEAEVSSRDTATRFVQVAAERFDVTPRAQELTDLMRNLAAARGKRTSE
jgi:glycosyltransferase involved in cell wall biosynthesis